MKETQMNRIVTTFFLIGGSIAMNRGANTTFAGDVNVAERFMMQVEEDLSPEGKGASQAELDLNNVEDQLRDVESL